MERTKHVHLDRVLHLTSRALALGAVRVSPMTVRWDISGDCRNSYTATLSGRAEADEGRYVLVKPWKQNTPAVLEIITRCRKCPNCLWARQRRWYGAAMQETAMAPRTWFGTLTLSPEQQFIHVLKAQKRCADRAVNYHTLTVAEQFVERHNAIGQELTKYVKRVRKNSGAKLRFLLVAEKHKSGDPHYHMLVHETNHGGKVLHRHLSNAWHLGFENWRLSDPLKPKSATYLCKYLSKSAEARVRASQRYGGASSDDLSRYLRALMLVVERKEAAEPRGSESGGETPSSLPVIDPHSSLEFW